MNLRVIFAACIIAAFGSSLITFDALGQKQSLKEKLVGTWLQVSVDVVSSDGARRPLFGENPKGIVIYTSDGYFSLMQARADLPKLGRVLINREQQRPPRAAAASTQALASELENSTP